MLVLSRKEEESIVIGGNIVITIVRIQGDVVRVGIDAPKNIKIIRSELREDDEPTTGTQDQPDPNEPRLVR